MTTPADDKQKNDGEKEEPKEKGGVAGTDSKEFDSGDLFKKNPESAKRGDD
jgi:hypothetical protein